MREHIRQTGSGGTVEQLSILPFGSGSLSELAVTDRVPAERAGLVPGCQRIPRGSPAWPAGCIVGIDTGRKLNEVWLKTDFPQGETEELGGPYKSI